MPSPEVSIIILNWNGLEDTMECLESLQKITYLNYEVIVVDNGSVRDEAKVLKQRFGSYVNIIQNDKNYGFAKGCNIGMKEVLNKGTDYVLLLNNDTVVAPNFLEELIVVTQRDPKIGIAGGKVYVYQNPEMVWFAGGFLNHQAGNFTARQAWVDSGQFDEVLEVGWITGCFMLLSRQVLLTIGMFDERFFFGGEDLDLCIRAASRGFRILFVPASKIWHKGFAAGKRKRLSGLPVYLNTLFSYGG
jgi:hypothetical protein